MGKYNTRRLAKKGEIDRLSSATYLYHIEGNSDNFNSNLHTPYGRVSEPYTNILPAYRPFDGTIRYNKDPNHLGVELVIGVTRESGDGYVDTITFNGVSIHMNSPEVVELKYPLTDVKVYDTNSSTLIEPKPKPSGYVTPTDTFSFIQDITFPDLAELSPAGLSIPSVPETTKRVNLGKGWFVFYIISNGPNGVSAKLRCSETYPNQGFGETYHVLGRLVPILDEKSKITHIPLNYVPSADKKSKSYDFEDWRWIQYSSGPIVVKDNSDTSFLGSAVKYTVKGSSTARYKVIITGGNVFNFSYIEKSYYIPSAEISGDWVDTKSYVYFLDLLPDIIDGYTDTVSRLQAPFINIRVLNVVTKSSGQITAENQFLVDSNLLAENVALGNGGAMYPKMYEAEVSGGKIISSGGTYGILVLGSLSKGMWTQIHKRGDFYNYNLGASFPVSAFSFQGSITKQVDNKATVIINGGTVYSFGSSSYISGLTNQNITNNIHFYITIKLPNSITDSYSLGNLSIASGYVVPVSTPSHTYVELGFIRSSPLRGGLEWVQTQFGNIHIGF